MRKVLWLLAGLVLWLAYTPVEAQILDEVAIEAVGDVALLRVRFAVPVRYENHSPPTGGRTLIVYVRTFDTGATATTRDRKSLKAVAGVAPAIEVRFERDAVEGPRLIVEFGAPVSYTVRQGLDNRSIDIALARPAAEAAPPVEPARHYAVNLLTAETPIIGLRTIRDGLRPIWSGPIYVTEVVVAGRKVFALRLGFFETTAAAETIRTKVAQQYPTASTVAVTESEWRSAGGVAPPPAPPVPKAPAAAAPAKPSAPPGPPTSDPDVLMTRARAALQAGDPAAAIRDFTRILELPASPHSRDALEFLGLARERNQQPQLAQVEYKLYLKLYPEGEGADRVRQRLANLEPASATTELKAPRPDSDRQTTVFGTLLQQYYRGNSKIDTTTTSGPTVGEQDTLSLVDQSTLINVLNVNARMRDGRYDNRAVLSADYNYDRLTHSDDSRVASAYGEIKDRELGYTARLGRQPSASGGVLTRFDGGLFSYSVSPTLGVNVVAGSPVDKVAPKSDRTFYGASVDLGGVGTGLSTNLYYLHQDIDGITDREAIGTEVRYFHNGASVFGLVDYETSYKELNIFLLQGNWISTAGTVYNVLLDYRKSPPLQTSNALIGETAGSIEELLATQSEDQIRSDARAKTATSKVAAAGVLHPLSTRWQVGADLTVTNTSGTPAAGSQPASASTGNIYTYAGKLIGTGLVTTSDVGVASVAHTTGNAYDANSITITHRVPFGRLRVDVLLKHYEQDNSNGTSLTRITPGVKFDYQWRRSVALEFEYNQERTTTSGVSTDETSVRDFFLLGYRWDF